MRYPLKVLLTSLLLTAAAQADPNNVGAKLPRWRFTDEAVWTDAKLPADPEQRVATIEDVPAAVAALARVPKSALVSMFVDERNLCAVATTLSKVGNRIGLNIVGKLTPESARCLATIAPSALVIDKSINLPALPSLRALAILVSVETDVAALSAAPQLESLALGESTDAGIRSLGTLRRLRSLELFSRNLTQEGFPPLAEVINLEWLSLTMTVTAGELAVIGKLPKLRRLDLGHAGVDGGDLAVLLPASRLETLVLRQDCKPAETIRRWKRAHPRVKVEQVRPTVY